MFFMMTIYSLGEKTKKFWREFFAPYLSDIFPKEIPERIKDKLVLMQIGAD
jgi:hypothetical protein